MVRARKYDAIGGYPRQENLYNVLSLNVAILKKMMRDPTDVIFVSDAGCFVGRFAQSMGDSIPCKGHFGHRGARGDRLIAENLARDRALMDRYGDDCRAQSR